MVVCHGGLILVIITTIFMKTKITDHEGLEVVALHYLDLDIQTGKGYRVK